MFDAIALTHIGLAIRFYYFYLCTSSSVKWHINQCHRHRRTCTVLSSTQIHNIIQASSCICICIRLRPFVEMNKNIRVYNIHTFKSFHSIALSAMSTHEWNKWTKCFISLLQMYSYYNAYMGQSATAHIFPGHNFQTFSIYASLEFIRNCFLKLSI